MAPHLERDTLWFAGGTWTICEDWITCLYRVGSKALLGAGNNRTGISPVLSLHQGLDPSSWSNMPQFVWTIFSRKAFFRVFWHPIPVTKSTSNVDGHRIRRSSSFMINSDDVAAKVLHHSSSSTITCFAKIRPQSLHVGHHL
jgi:hypothetical protein